jgi:replicative DNA helicase
VLEKVFRSIIDIPKDGRMSIDKEELLENFRAFQKSRISCEMESYKKLYYKILDHFKRYIEMPAHSRLVDHFMNETGCEGVIVALDEIKKEKPFIGGNYKDVLREVKAAQDLEALRDSLSEANEIAQVGRKVGKAHMKGVEAALDYFAMKSKEIRSQNQDFKTEAQVLDQKEVQSTKDRYQHREENQLDALGVYTGLQKIDEVLGGLKPTELMIVGAYTAQGKTTFSLNVVYNAIYSGWDSALFTLEMSLEEMQDMVYCLHTSNYSVWQGTEFERYIGKIEYNDIREGKLTPELKRFYYAALDDLEANEDYGRLHIVQPENSTFTVDDINIKCLEINSDLKTKGRKLEFIAIDYLRLLGVPGRSQGEREDLNNKILGIKRLFLTFNNGQGLRGVSPHQIKREGYVRALSNGGMYLLSDLSDSSEIEKSGDVVITLFMDDLMRKSGIFKICHLKARRNTLFHPFEASANLANKRIYSKVEVSNSDLLLETKSIDLTLEED